ncbi:MAG: hypothetical protein HXY50_14505 [Ignavibacteriaceae bacterium]|nr:hypothetical protein [Ignavibacteriaceae bacterium]
MKSNTLITFLFCIISFSLQGQNYKVLESTSDHVKIEFNFEKKYQVIDTIIDGNKFNVITGDEYSLRQPGEPWLPNVYLNIGIPVGSSPNVKILSLVQDKISSVFILPYPDSIGQPLSKLLFTDSIYNVNTNFPKRVSEISSILNFRYASIASLVANPYQFNPITRELIHNKKLVLQIDFFPNKMNALSVISKDDPLSFELVKSNVINPDQAIGFIGELISTSSESISANSYWYNPAKNYYKIFLKNKGVYRITHDYLVSQGVPVSGVLLDKLELINNGISVPIDVVDSNSDSIFSAGDYFQFVGYPPSPTPYNTQNIYNLTNVYWFSYESDTLSSRFKNKSGFPQTWTNTYQSNLTTLHYEEDKFNEELGYANDDKRDFWFWGKASAENGNILQSFSANFSSFPEFILDSNRVNLRVNLHGMTTTTNSQCINNHQAYISLTNQPIGAAVWKNQAAYTFSKSFYVSNDSIKIYPTGNVLNVMVNGDACSVINSDEIRINWFEFDYWRSNRTKENNFSFQFAPPYEGINRYWLYGWQRNHMKIYIPSRGQLISNPQIVNDEYKSVLFVDTLNEKTEYFCVGNDYYLTPDSMHADSPSDLRNTANGADYIIITHPEFFESAAKLAEYRSNNLNGINSPRVKIVDIHEIYDEFSYGLLDPISLKNFVKYTFESWQAPAPAYVVIIGDLSSDYRKILSSSRPNFVPSIQYFSRNFGQVPSDNLIVDVIGNDMFPDIAIGRISCESKDEANVIVEKIINYPADASKPWKENVLFLASGLSEIDQIKFGFNDSSKALERDLLIPSGYTSSKVFNFPDPRIPEDMKFKGAGPEMREELNKGAVLTNYYGHGGGGQWDLIFTDDDILELHNNNKLPLVLSVTCYTAQFDNQECFGEIFVNIPGKGAVGFLGSTGLTYWGPATILNRRLYEQIFLNKIHVIGKAILNAKSNINGFNDMIAQLTYFGDPALELALPKYPDFAVNTSDITINPESPLKSDTVSIKVHIKNYGTVFSDSLTVEVFENVVDMPNLIGTVKLTSFGQDDSVNVKWIPDEAGIYNIIVRVNEDNALSENDHSDNIASATFGVFDLSSPGIIHPIDGFSSDSSKIEFMLADISENIGKNLSYFFEIDTSLNFTNPLIQSQGVEPFGGVVIWYSPPTLQQGEYFWRVRISDGENFSDWSKTRSFSVTPNSKSGYYAFGNILKTFSANNMSYSETDNSLQLNLSLLPPRPSNETFVEDFISNTTVTDSVGMTTITTDGTYIYFGNIWYYAQNFNSAGKSFIYKIGTGNNGTVQGNYYGTVPNFYDRISYQIFYHSDGFIYAATGNPFYLKKIHPETGDTSSIFIPSGFLEWRLGKPVSGSYYITSDGEYVYNLALYDSLGNQKYVLRTLDPLNNWNLAKPDIQLTSTSYPGFSGFFVADGYVYPYENNVSGFMRRIRISDGFFEEEWITYLPFQSYYAWCWDWQNNDIYASVFRSNFTPKIAKFKGRYQNAKGSLEISEIGPAKSWYNLSYNIEPGSSASSFSSILFGHNQTLNLWDTLGTQLPNSFSLSEINSTVYDKLKLKFDFIDTTFGVSASMKFKELNVSYLPLPEISLSKSNISFQPDSILQGFPTSVVMDVYNYGSSNADSLRLEFYLDDADLSLYQTNINIPADTFKQVDFVLQTATLAPQMHHKIKAISSLQKGKEYFVYNNIIEKNFYIARDSVKPVFSITVDGKEILDGDIVSAKPEVLISLKDDSPLPLDTSLFTIIFDNIPLSFNRPDVEFVYTPYPNSEATIKWKPELQDGKHTLEVLAKDASGNFFDSTSSRIIFYVYNQPNLLNVFNYPNPFKNDTHFTFELRGSVVPDEFLIKVYTIAGRLIREISVPPSQMSIGFNRIYWDGKDQDGDEIANGMYFYRVISRLNNETKIITEKLAKIR